MMENHQSSSSASQVKYELINCFSLTVSQARYYTRLFSICSCTWRTSSWVSHHCSSTWLSWTFKDAFRSSVVMAPVEQTRVFVNTMVYCTTSRTPEESAFHPTDDGKEQERHDKMNMMECPITKQQPEEKRADNDEVLANKQPFV